MPNIVYCIFIFFIVVIMLLSLYVTEQPYCYSSTDNYTPKPKTFSSTQTWCPELKLQIIASNDIDKWKIVNGTLPFPSNGSETTNNEVRYLNQLKKLRNPKIKSEIITQKMLDGIFRYIYNENGLSLIEINRLLLNIDNMLGVIVFTLKNHHNRVRPSFLSDSLEIEEVLGENPCHPSYPSGHATQAWFIAYSIIDFLNYTGKNEQDISKYLKRAEKVAHGREIAGVHYPSDSAYGKLIAKNLVDKIFNGPNNCLLKDFSKLTHKQINNMMIDGVLP